MQIIVYHGCICGIKFSAQYNTFLGFVFTFAHVISCKVKVGVLWKKPALEPDVYSVKTFALYITDADWL